MGLYVTRLQWSPYTSVSPVLAISWHHNMLPFQNHSPDATPPYILPQTSLVLRVVLGLRAVACYWVSAAEVLQDPKTILKTALLTILNCIKTALCFKKGLTHHLFGYSATETWQFSNSLTWDPLRVQCLRALSGTVGNPPAIEVPRLC